MLHLHLGVPIPKVVKGRDRGGVTCLKLSKVCQKVMILVYRRLAVVSTSHEVGLESQPSQLPSGFPSQRPNLQFTTLLNIMIRDPNKFMLGLIPWCSQIWLLKLEGSSKSQKRKPRG